MPTQADTSRMAKALLTTDDQWWQQFHNEQIYRGVPREDIPWRMREQVPIEVPPVEPVWPEDFWRHQIR